MPYKSGIARGGKYKATWTQATSKSARWVKYPGQKDMMSMSNQFGITARVVGLNNALNGLNNMIAGIYGRSEIGLIKAAEYLHEQTETVPPTTPKKTGRLRKSWYTQIIHGSTSGPVIEIGYDINGDKGAPEKAPYALYVHEMTQPPYTEPIDWTEPGSGPQWFQTHVMTDKFAMAEIIKENIKAGL